MCIGDWNRLVSGIPPETPVFFHLPEPVGEDPDPYFDGVGAELSRYWDWRQGWLPCVMVTLQKEAG